VEVDRRPITAKRVRALEFTIVLQAGDTEVTFVFDVAHYDAVGEIVKPRRRRQISEFQRQKARERMIEYNRRTPVPDASRAEMAHAEAVP